MNTKWMTIETHNEDDNLVEYALVNLDTIWRVRVFKDGAVELLFINGKVLSLSGVAAERFIMGYLPAHLDEVPVTLHSGFWGP